MLPPHPSHPLHVQARFVLCSEPPSPGLRDYFGVWGGTLLPSKTAAAAAAAIGGEGEVAADAVYEVGRGAAAALMDELEEREMWSRYGMR